MPLGKITIHPIANDAERRSRHQRRSDGLLKKVQELSVLCNVPACVVIYDTDDTAEPNVWPSMQETTNLMQSSLDMLESSVGNKMLDREALLQKSIAKAENKLDRRRSQNRQLEINIIMNDIIAGRRKNLDDLDSKQIEELEWVLAMRHRGIHDHVHVLRSEAVEASSLPPSQPAAQPASQVVSGEQENMEGDDSPRAFLEGDSSV
ncbi:hypothetical protein ABZP36_017218 [Zizania latifolia]